MSNTNDSTQKCNERSIDSPLGPGADPFFRLLFERSADAISLFDPVAGRFIESNDAVVRQTGAPDKAALGHASPVEISPEYQPDGRLSREKAEEMVKLALAKGSHRFEWLHQHPQRRLFVSEVRLVRLPSEGRQLVRASISP